MTWTVAILILLAMLELAARLLRGQDSLSTLICLLLHLRAALVCAAKASYTAARYCVEHYRHHHEDSRRIVVTPPAPRIARIAEPEKVER